MNDSNMSNISSISLARELEIYGLAPTDYYDNGCFVGYRTIESENDAGFEIFRYPIRIDAFIAILCEEGAIKLTADLENYTLEAGTLFILRPGAILRMNTICKASIYAVLCEENYIKNIDIDPKLIPDLFLHASSSPCLTLTQREKTQIDQSFRDIEIERDSDGKDEFSAEIMQSIIRTLAYRVYRIIQNHIVMQPRVQTSSRNHNDAYFNEFMRILSQFYMQQRSVAFYADKLHLTPKYMTTIIRRVSGRTASQWINDYVILEAKNLLKYSSLNVQEVADRLHFPNQSFFGKYFRQHTGMTPTDYKMHPLERVGRRK